MFDILFALGVGHRRLKRNFKQGKVPILLFHRVSPVADPVWPPLTPAEFESILALLARNYDFLSLEDLVEGKIPKGRPSCVVVFDDAWVDFRDFALPVLEKYQVPTALFVPAENVDKQLIIWTSWVDQLVAQASGPDWTVDLAREKLNYTLNSDRDRMLTSLDLQNRFKRLPDQERREILEEWGRSHEFELPKELTLLTWEELKQLPDWVTLHAHSLTHPYLPSIADDGLLDLEINGSGDLIDQKTGKRPAFFSYPMGGLDARVMAVTRKTFDAGFAVDNDLVETGKLSDADYQYRIPRFNISDSNPKEVFLRINGFHKSLGR